MSLLVKCPIKSLPLIFPKITHILYQVKFEFRSDLIKSVIIMEEGLCLVYKNIRPVTGSIEMLTLSKYLIHVSILTSLVFIYTGSKPVPLLCD